MSIKIKILLAFLLITSACVAVIVAIFQQNSATWFEEDAHSKLSIGGKIINSQLKSISEAQQLAVKNIQKHEMVNTSSMLINSLLEEGVDGEFDSAYAEMAKDTASQLRLYTLSGHIDYMVLTDKTGKVISYYNSTSDTKIWLTGHANYLQQQGKGSPTPLSSIPKEIINLIQLNVSLAIPQTVQNIENLVQVYKDTLYEMGTQNSLGDIYSGFILNNEHLNSVHELSGTELNIYVGQNFVSGTVPSLKTIDSDLTKQALQSQKSIYGTQQQAGQKYYIQLSTITNTNGLDAFVANIMSAQISEQRLSDATRLLIFIAIIALSVGALINLLTVSILMRPLQKLAATVTEAVNKGDYSLRCNSSSSDEVGKTVNAFNHLMDNLNTSISVISSLMDAVAKGDLTTRLQINARGDLQHLSDNINSSVAAMRNTIAQVILSNESLTKQIEASSKSSDIVRSGASNQLESINLVAEALEQSSIAISDVAKNTENANDNAQQAVDVVEDGKAKMLKMTEVVSLINRTSAKISDKVSTIQSIAAQTNLLALNAAIEAARAGEQGRGFAVVADEVRALAAHSATAADQITELVEEGVKVSESGVKTAEEVGNDMRNIETAALETKEMLHLIAVAMEQQDQTISEIKSNVINLRDIGASNSKAANEIDITYRQLLEIAAGTLEKTRQFKIGD